jgi:hypothetical protein
MDDVGHCRVQTERQARNATLINEDQQRHRLAQINNGTASRQAAKSAEDRARREL